MSTSTLEDITVVEKVADLIFDSLNREHATYAQFAQPITDHYALLRTELHSLKESQRQLLQVISGVSKITQRDQNKESVVQSVERIAELAEIGRLAVEERKAFMLNDHFKRWERTQKVRDEACDAYIAKYNNENIQT